MVFILAVGNAVVVGDDVFIVLANLAIQFPPVIQIAEAEHLRPSVWHRKQLCRDVFIVD